MTNAIRLVSTWTALYTAGLTPEVREERRAEIASDLWEHGRFGATCGHRHAHIDAAIVWRCIRGMAADVMWRRRQSHVRPFGVRYCNYLSWVATSMACGLLIFVPAGIALGYLISPTMRTDPRWLSVTLIAGSIFVAEAIGMGLAVRRRRAGLSILGVGIWSVVAMMPWAWAVVVPAALVATAGLWRVSRHPLRRPLGRQLQHPLG